VLQVIQLDVTSREDWLRVKEYIQTHLPATSTGGTIQAVILA
jgi:hypothetical protein